MSQSQRPSRACNSRYSRYRRQEPVITSDEEDGDTTEDNTTVRTQNPSPMESNNITLAPARIVITSASSTNSNMHADTDWDTNEQGQLAKVAVYRCEICRKVFTELVARNRHHGQCRRKLNTHVSLNNTQFDEMIRSLPQSSPLPPLSLQPTSLAASNRQSFSPEARSEYTEVGKELNHQTGRASQQGLTESPEPPTPGEDVQQPLPEQQPALLVAAETAQMAADESPEILTPTTGVDQPANNKSTLPEEHQTRVVTVETATLTVDSPPATKTPQQKSSNNQHSTTTQSATSPDQTTSSRLLQDGDGNNSPLQSSSNLPTGNILSAQTTPHSNMVQCPWCSRFFTGRVGLGTHKRFCEFKPTENGGIHRDAVTTQNTEERSPPPPPLPPSAPVSVPQQNTNNITVNNNANNVASRSRSSNVLWGEKTVDEVLHDTNLIYNKIVFFRQNLFKLPSGHAGKDFIRECTRLIKGWSSSSNLKGVAWKCLMIMPALLLQKPSSVSKCKDHTAALKRRLASWQRGDFIELLHECQTIQGRIKASVPKNNIDATSKKFASLMKNGKLNAAVKLLTNSMEGGILPLDEETMTLLQAKHPEPADFREEAVVDIEPVASHPVVFEEVNAEAVRTAALKTKGGAGPSGLDADGWRHILASRNFGNASEELRSEFANAIKKLCTEKVDIITENGYATSDIEALLSCRLIPLDKCPGLRPIGIGEVLRRIAGKVFMTVVKGDVQDSVGSLQVCAGQAGGCEAAIHAMRTLYENEETDAVLLIDAANAFNSINRTAMLKNIERICPAAYLYAYNCYAAHARLFVLGGQEIRSMEGTTQGDPPSMAFYAIGLLPLIWCLAEADDPAKQVAYADDLTGGGELAQLKHWLDSIVENGPKLGYNAEPTKSWLIVKEEKLCEAEAMFQNSGINITTHGKKHLGAAIGSVDYRHEFVTGLVDKWVHQIETLSRIASYEPHAAYIAFTSCIRHRYSFYLRTIPGISQLLQPLENAIRTKLIPALTEGRDVSDDERRLLSLPPRLGGMGLIMPTEMADQEFEFSQVATVDLTNAIIDQMRELSPDLERKSKEAKSKIRKERRDNQTATLEDLVLRMSPAQKRANEICREIGASNWLTALPIEDKGFHLNKREFWDAINLRYTWPISRLPSKCACGSSFDVAHALSCKKGGFVGRRHNAIRDMTADLLSEVCTDVCVEPHLQELSGETFSFRTANTSREARLDIAARNVWSDNQRAFFDVRVFDPNARRFQNQTLSQAYLANEREKKRHYNERVLEVENGTFTPLVFSVHGGMSPECRVFYKRLSALLSEKRGENYSVVATWVRTRTSFSLLRSALMSIRGTRHRYYQPKVAEVDMELDLTEATVRPV